MRCWALMLLTACAPLQGDIDVEDETPIDDPDQQVDIDFTFVDDCEEGLNDTRDAAVWLHNDDDSRYAAELCVDEVDFYAIQVPPEQYLSVELIIDGNGRNGSNQKTDLDLIEVEDPENPYPAQLDLFDGDTIWASATERDYERLAWYNPGPDPVTHYFAVDGHRKGAAAYELDVQQLAFHEGYDCNEFYSNTGENGPCNKILQFPQANVKDDGYVVSHPAEWSNLRREVIYLIRHAAAATRAAYPDTKPLGLLDMSERYGDTPGTAQGSLRHPEGTHVSGNDIDIAYYQNRGNNLGRSVCPEDGYFCTGDPHLLDAERTAFFMAQLFDSSHVRVIGVDPKIYDALQPAADDLLDRGMITQRQRNRLRNYLAYGDGWPFHQHHMHFSWEWESGVATARPDLDGCEHVLEEPEQRVFLEQSVE